MWSTSTDRWHEAARSKGFWREADRSLHITQRFTCHAHLHGLVSDTAWNRDGSEVSIGGFDSSLLSCLFQHRVLEMMVQQHRLSPEFAQKLRVWSPSGFGVYCSRPVPPEDRPEPPTTRSSGTRFRIGPTEELELFSGLAISLCLFSLPTGPLASPRLRSHPRYTISTLWIPFDFPIHLISAPFGLLSGVSTLFPRTQSKRKFLLIS